MNDVRQDALTPLRLWSRGYLAGFATAAIDETGAAIAESHLLARFQKLRLPAVMVEMLMDEAYQLVKLSTPMDTDHYLIRWRTAEMMLELLPECGP